VARTEEEGGNLKEGGETIRWPAEFVKVIWEGIPVPVAVSRMRGRSNNARRAVPMTLTWRADSQPSDVSSYFGAAIPALRSAT
jgi:hypothetical protein